MQDDCQSGRHLSVSGVPWRSACQSEYFSAYDLAHGKKGVNCLYFTAFSCPHLILAFNAYNLQGQLYYKWHIIQICKLIPLLSIYILHYEPADQGLIVRLVGAFQFIEEEFCTESSRLHDWIRWRPGCPNWISLGNRTIWASRQSICGSSHAKNNLCWDAG